MQKLWIGLLILSVVLIGCLHAFTPGSMHFFHDTFRRLSYFPITIAAILFGVRGGLAISGLTSLAFIPHLLIFIGESPETWLSELTEVALYLLAGFVIGLIAEKEKTLRKKFQALSEKLERSYQRLHEGAKQLIDIEEQLRKSQKISTIGQLSASIVHEVKNPLASIRGAAEILLEDYPPDNKKRKFPEIIIKETGRLNKTVNDILHFAKPAFRQKDNFKPLIKIIDHVSSLVTAQLARNNVELTINITQEAEEFHADGDQLGQVFLNLILNGSDAVGKNGTISLQAIRETNGIKISIKDTGPGVPEDMKEKIFDPFFTGKTEGTGLGLAISRKIIESQGGLLSLDNTNKTGAEFIITIPEEETYE